MRIRIRENISGTDGRVLFTAGVVYTVVEKGYHGVTVFDNFGGLTALFNEEFVVTI